MKQDYMIEKKKTERIASDTMTSVMTTFTKAMTVMVTDKQLLLLPEGMLSQPIKEILSIYEACQQKYHGSQSWWTTNFFITTAAALYKEDKDENEKSEFYELINKNYPAMTRFLKTYHTLGNYCPVPVKFNSARSGKGIYDYWDLTLMKIREWYLTENDDLLKRELLHNDNKGSFENCKKWLNSFKTTNDDLKCNEHEQNERNWHKFVDTLYMQDYVYDDYEVKPFWAGHNWHNLQLPDNLFVINDALKEINDRIKKRSDRMIEALRQKLCKNE